MEQSNFHFNSLKIQKKKRFFSLRNQTLVNVERFKVKYKIKVFFMASVLNVLINS